MRVQKNCGYGTVFGACLLFSLYISQFVVHLGGFDFICLYVPGFLLFWHGLRVLAGVFVLFFGTCLFLARMKLDFSLQSFGETFIKYGLSGPSALSRLQRGFTIIKGFLWGIIFALFCATWPMSDQMVDVIYAKRAGAPAFFLMKIFLVELAALLPFFVMLFLVVKFFRSPDFQKKITGSRVVVLIFSAVCVASGCGTLIYYARLLFNLFG
jgi:hypothetical protein